MANERLELDERKPKPPKAERIEGAPQRVEGRKSEVKQKGQKWEFQFKRGDMKNVEFDTEAEAKEYARRISVASIKGAPLRVNVGR